MRVRNALCDKGFSFEYSATFGQAVKGIRALTDTYAKSILFDYSYRYFYGDGFGKDYQILNLDEGTQANHLDAYLVACLLAFFQQQRLFKEKGFAFKSEEHTSELQSLMRITYAVFCLKKKTQMLDNKKQKITYY